MIKTAILLSAISTAWVAQAADASVASQPESPHAVVTVDYADTLLGISAMLAVRACVTSDLHRGSTAPSGGIESSVDTRRLIIEHQIPTEQDVVVRVIDRDGLEISRHEGAKNVCGYARLAGAFIAMDRAPVTRVGQ